MRKFFTNQELNVKNITLTEDYNHIVNVLRMKVGDGLVLFNGDGCDYTFRIDKINKKTIDATFNSKKTNLKENASKVTLFQAFIKQDNLELVSQKLTELGIDQLGLFSSDYTNMKCKETVTEKLKKVSIEACKQCERSKPLDIFVAGTFDAMIERLKDFDAVIFAYEKSKKSLKDCLRKLKAKNIAIVVGPEGGFSEQEKNKMLELSNVEEVSISKNILRAETASIMLSSVVMYEIN